MNSGEALDNDGSSSQMPGLQRSMLSAGSLTVVVISNSNPGHTIGLNTTQRIYLMLGVLCIVYSTMQH